MRPLEGILVVTLEQAVAAPTATRRLADAGARVIKLERPEGDFARKYDAVVGGESAYFIWLNRGKESVTIDLKSIEGRTLFEALIAKADVFVQNLKPGALDRLGFAPAKLRARHPKLITCSISGYGSTGPLASRKAYDLLIQAESGIAGVTGSPDEPTRVGVSLVDYGSGLNAYEAILEALIARGRTGIGSEIELSMFDAMTELMAVPLLYGQHGKAPKRVGLKHPSVAPYGLFPTSDGTAVLIAIQNDREWRVFADKVLGNPALADDPKFATNIARVENRPETDGMIAAVTERYSGKAIAELLADADIAFGMLNSVEDVLDHPCFRTVDVPHPAGTAKLPAPPARFAGHDPHVGAVPALGADTERVRDEFLRG
jgi:itaconate CoA-transferase